MHAYPIRGGTGRCARCRHGFTLIELLTVIAIITLLIGILVPSLSKARDSAKNTKTKSVMKAVGDGLELFRNDNERELRGQNYPPSTPGDDPTAEGLDNQSGEEDMCGAQWLVRYLLGKKLDGYVARETVPQAILALGTSGWEQKLWYGSPGDEDWPEGVSAPLDRRGPYVHGVTLKAPKELPGAPSDPNGPRYTNPVIVDSFTMPILYYAANTRHAEKPNANIATYKGPPSNFAATYTFKDNALFTGLCTEGQCIVKWWDFGAGEQKLKFGPEAWNALTPPVWANEIAQHTTSFPYYIMSKNAYESSGKKTVIPNRMESFLLISPGKDGLFGTKDDVTNFN